MYGSASILHRHDIGLKRRSGWRSATCTGVRCCSTLACSNVCQGRYRSPRVGSVHSVISSSTSVASNGASFSTPRRAKRLAALGDHLTSPVLSTKRVGNWVRLDKAAYGNRRDVRATRYVLGCTGHALRKMQPCSGPLCPISKRGVGWGPSRTPRLPHSCPISLCPRHPQTG
jgi:hypothetical protein